MTRGSPDKDWSTSWWTTWGLAATVLPCPPPPLPGGHLAPCYHLDILDLLPAGIRHADHVLVISEATKRDVVEKNIAEWAGSISEEEPRLRQGYGGQAGTKNQEPSFDRRPDDRGRLYREEERPRRFDERPPRRDRPQGGQRDRERLNAPSTSARGRPVSLNQAFSNAPVDFKGRRNEERPKKEVDTAGLKKILEESLKK